MSKTQCFFKKGVVKDKKKEGWLESKQGKQKKRMDDQQGIVLMERK